MKTIAIIAAVAAIATTAPAFAQAKGTFAGSKVTYNEKTGSYCFKDVPTGSRIARSDCRTKSEWAAVGLNISHKPTVELAQR